MESGILVVNLPTRKAEIRALPVGRRLSSRGESPTANADASPSKKFTSENTDLLVKMRIVRSLSTA